jgi:hypothetical protein
VAATGALAAREVHAAVVLDMKEYWGRDVQGMGMGIGEVKYWISLSVVVATRPQ